MVSLSVTLGRQHRPLCRNRHMHWPQPSSTMDGLSTLVLDTEPDALHPKILMTLVNSTGNACERSKTIVCSVMHFRAVFLPLVALPHLRISFARVGQWRTRIEPYL